LQGEIDKKGEKEKKKSCKRASKTLGKKKISRDTYTPRGKKSKPRTETTFVLSLGEKKTKEGAQRADSKRHEE